MEKSTGSGGFYMKATGIVRRIDDLGRVVIPKEIRRTLRIREGDPLEIFTDREGEIILKKYSPIGELGMFAAQYCESLAQTLNCTVCITDCDQVIAVNGNGKKDFNNKNISKKMENFLKKREMKGGKERDSFYIPIVQEDENVCEEVICPILCEGDVIGSVILLNREAKKKFDESEQKAARCAAAFLGKQMEQ